ncbi:hypothetical protein [Spartinivicinus ruber]|uniref:hypothetical protein n=1 Tax=Spartinivicinus ruber TaxID=2683272 RepID=UPI0013D73101|nr:hypothetical protein [Spartinivicinus ruber]
MRQPDIEVYIKTTDLEAILNWLEKHFDNLTATNSHGRSHHYFGMVGPHAVPILIVEKASGRHFSSVWFNSSESPWETDIDCAHDAYKALNIEVRCNGNFWEEGKNNENEWWQINGAGEGPVIWHDT